MHNSVESIVRDSMGYVWVGTNYGLNRLDGYRTVNYIHDPADSTSIPGNFVKTLFIDHKGQLWIGTIGGGMCRYNREKDSFDRYLSLPHQNSLSGLNVTAITEDQKGNIWIGTIGEGVTCLNPETGRMDTYLFDSISVIDQKFSNVRTLHPDRYGNIWVGFDFDRNGIYKIDPASKKISFHGLPSGHPDFSNVGAVTSIGEMSDGSLLFTIWNCQIYRLHPLHDTQIRPWEKSGLFQNDHLTSVVVSPEDQIWIGTWENGLYLIDSPSGKVTHFRRDPAKPNSLYSNSIRCLCLDKLNLWIGFREQGINLLNTRETLFRSIDTEQSANRMFSEIDAHCMTSDDRGNIWIGTRGQGLWQFRPQTGFLKNYHMGNSNIGTDHILSILYSTKDQTLWLGTDGRFVAAFDPGTGTSSYVEHHDGDWSSVFSLAETDDYIWCGTWGAGMKKLHKRTRTYQTIHFDPDDQYRNSLFSIRPWGDNLWLANVGQGIIRYHIPSNSYEYFNATSLPGFPKDSPNSIFIDDDSTLWIATAGGGLIHLFPRKRTFTVFTKEIGLSSNVIQAVLGEPGTDKLWCSTNSGITLFDKTQKSANTFYRHDGLKSDNTNISSLVFCPNEKLLFVGTTKGISYCKTDQKWVQKEPKKVVINLLEVMGNEVHPGQEGILKIPLDLSDDIVLSRPHRFFTLHFTSMEFSPSFKSGYLYKLEGFNKNWIYTSFQKNFVQYTNLDPGSYTFRVKAFNSDGIISEGETSLKINVKPAIWQTLFFKISLALILILGLTLLLFYRYHSLLKSQLQLEMKVSDRTSEIQFQKEQIERQKHQLELANKTKDKFVSIIGHDLKNPMSSIDQLIDLLLEQGNEMDVPTRDKILFNLKKSSEKTLNLLDDLMIWAKTQANLITITRKPIDVTDIIDEAAALCEAMARKKKISIIRPAEAHFIVNADRNTVATVLRNLLTNALKFSRENSKVEIAVSDTEVEVTLCVRDQGIGMTQATIDKLFKVENIISREGTQGETGTGLGLILCREFILLNGGRIWAESEAGKGSTFCFTLEKFD
ncbi:MAG TPA: two-component regulator propeller domain-containing protein [Prolixibacteraceae bacterium]|nr:two-component regulator propeller domain-containing protein [Prolixibacteraceae bacterium]